MLPGVGVFGTDSAAHVLVPLLRAKGFKVEAIWGRTSDAASQAAEVLGIPFSTCRVDEVLLRKDVDLVCIACPPNLHAQIAVKALGIGKHVVCDRPAGLCQPEVLKMVRAAQYYPLLISLLSHGLRFLPAFAMMRRCIQNDDYVGDVTVCEVRVHCGHAIDAQRSYNWTCDRVMGGGVLNAVGSHVIDALAYVTGQRAIRVHGLLRTFRPTTEAVNGIRHVTGDDFCSFELAMPNGALATVTLNNCLPGQFTQELMVCGTKGHLVIRGGDLYGQRLAPSGTTPKEEVLYLDVEDLNHARLDGEEAGIATPPRIYVKGLVKLVGALREAFAPVEDKQSWIKEPVAAAATFDDGQYVQAVIDAVRRSNSSREWINVDLLSEDPDPNPYLSAAVRRSIISS